MRLLIIGGSGFIGRHLITYLLKKYPGYEIVNLDKLTYQHDISAGEQVSDHPKYKFIEGDIRDSKVIEPLVKEAEVIINLATSLKFDHEGSFLTTDLVGTFNLLEAIRKDKIKKLIHISDYVIYGDAVVEENSAKVFTETDSLNPKTPEAASKAGADRLAYSYFLTYGTPVTILRCANNFGPYQYPTKLIPYFIIQALEGKKLPIHGEGAHIRDWIYVEDQVAAIDFVLHGKNTDGQVYNVGASCEKSVLEITELILTIMDRSKDLIEFVAEPIGHTQKRSVDVSKIKNELNWQAKWNFNEAMEKTVDWYIKNHRWWEKIMQNLKIKDQNEEGEI